MTRDKADTVLVNVHEAKTHLSRLLARVAAGEEFTIARAGKPVARLVPYKPPVKARVCGRLRGKIRMAQDFDASLPHETLELFEA